MPILSGKPRLLLTLKLLSKGKLAALGFIDIDVMTVKDEDSRLYRWGLTLDGIKKGEFVADIQIRQDVIL